MGKDRKEWEGEKTLNEDRKMSSAVLVRINKRT